MKFINKKPDKKIIDKANEKLEQNNVNEMYEIIGTKLEIFKKNFLAGLAKGLGMGIGFTILTALLIYIMQKIVILNIPGIGQFVKDIIDIVEQK